MKIHCPCPMSGVFRRYRAEITTLMILCAFSSVWVPASAKAESLFSQMVPGNTASPVASPVAAPYPSPTFVDFTPSVTEVNVENVEAEPSPTPTPIWQPELVIRTLEQDPDRSLLHISAPHTDSDSQQNTSLSITPLQLFPVPYQMIGMQSPDDQVLSGSLFQASDGSYFELTENGLLLSHDLFGGQVTVAFLGSEGTPQSLMSSTTPIVQPTAENVDVFMDPTTDLSSIHLFRIESALIGEFIPYFAMRGDGKVLSVNDTESDLPIVETIFDTGGNGVLDLEDSSEEQPQEFVSFAPAEIQPNNLINYQELDEEKEKEPEIIEVSRNNPKVILPNTSYSVAELLNKDGRPAKETEYLTLTILHEAVVKVEVPGSLKPKDAIVALHVKTKKGTVKYRVRLPKECKYPFVKLWPTTLNDKNEARYGGKLLATTVKELADTVKGNKDDLKGKKIFKVTDKNITNIRLERGDFEVIVHLVYQNIIVVPFRLPNDIEGITYMPLPNAKLTDKGGLQYDREGEILREDAYEQTVGFGDKTRFRNDWPHVYESPGWKGTAYRYKFR